MDVLLGGWDSGWGAGPAPSGKRRFWLRFGPFGATSVVPPTEAPGGEIPAPQEDSTEPPSLPPGRPAASPPAAQALLPGRPGFPPAGQEVILGPDLLQAPFISGIRHCPGHSGHSRNPKNMPALQIHHVLRGQEWHHLTPGLTPGIDCSHELTIPNRKAWCWTYSQGAERAAGHLVVRTRPTVAYWSSSPRTILWKLLSPDAVARVNLGAAPSFTAAPREKPK